MNKVRLTINSIGLLLLFVTVTSLAQAQATRTWVSGVGDDVNPCSRTAPCKTFAGAISKTAAGGEINCIDPGGFGGITITKSITIDGGGTFASILAPGFNGVVINANATTDTVILRNLSINGAGTGIFGVRYLAAKNVIIENVIIQRFTDSLVDMNLTANGNLDIKNLSGDNGAATVAGAAGVRVRTSTGLARCNITDSYLAHNPIGVSAENNSFVTVRDTVIKSNTTSATPVGIGAQVAPTAGAASTLVLENCHISGANEGVRSTTAGGAVVTTTLSNNAFTGNNVAVNSGAGVTVLRFQNNKFSKNTTDFSGPNTPASQQ